MPSLLVANGRRDSGGPRAPGRRGLSPKANPEHEPRSVRPPFAGGPLALPLPWNGRGGAAHSGRRPGLRVLLLAFLDPFSPPRRPSSSCSSSWTSRRQRAPCWPPKVLGTSQRGPLPRDPLLPLAWRHGVGTGHPWCGVLQPCGVGWRCGLRRDTELVGPSVPEHRERGSLPS